jgi:5'-3' exonuclease
MNLSKRLSSKDISIVWDSKGGSLKRNKLYSEIKLNEFNIINESDKVLLYKEGRKDNSNIYDNLETYKEELSCFGITQYSLDGFEADDLAAWLVKNNSKDKNYLFSTDNDWKSLINSKTFILSSSKKELEIISSLKFKEKWGFKPEKMHDYKCFLGDKSDRIPGIKRINKEKVIEFINEEGIDKIISGKKIKNEYISNLLKSNSEILELLKFNHSIVSFDLPETLEPFNVGKTDEKKIKSIKNKYQQERRWSWGASDDPLFIKWWLTTPGVPFVRKTLMLINVLVDHFLWPVNWFIITIAANIMPFVNPVFTRTALGYNLPRIAGFILTICLVATAAMLLIDHRQRPKHEKVSKKRQLLFPLEFLLLPIVGFFLSALPALISHTQLMLGKRLEYKVTEKL